jgi:hypothetical protein
MKEEIKPKFQVRLFDAYGSHPHDKKMETDYPTEYTRNLINLRQELKLEIPCTTYLTHGIHNVYPAKFIPQVPRFIIKSFNLKDKLILDPFAGSGTTAVESLITGNSNISNDINPLMRFLIDVKTLKLDPKYYFTYIDRLKHHIDSIFKGDLRFFPKWENLDYWYPEDILSVLTKIWGGIHNINESESDIKYILKTSALHLSRKYSYAEDKSPKLFRSKQKATKMRELTTKFNKHGEKLLRKELFEKAKNYLECIIQFNSKMKTEYKKIDSFDDAKGQFLMTLNKSIEELILPDEIADCIITSPPYVYAQEYFRSTKIDMYWLDMIDDESIRKLTKKEIGQKFNPFCDLNIELSKIESYNNTLDTVIKLSKNFKTKNNISRFIAYFNDMLYFIQLSERLLVKKGILAICIGEPKVFGHHIKTRDIILEMMQKNNFNVKYTFFDIIKSRHLSKKRFNENPNGMPGEWLIIGEKP